MRRRLLAVALFVLVAGMSLTACGVGSGTTPSTTTGTPTIAVTLTDTSVTASQAAFTPGIHCHFVITNAGTQPHRFWLMPQDMAQMMSEMPMGQWHEQILYSSQTVAPGQTVRFDYTFPMMHTQQALAFGCYTATGQSISIMPIRVG